MNLARLATVPLLALLTGAGLVTASPAHADERHGTCAYRVKAGTHVYVKPRKGARSYEKFGSKGRTIGACESGGEGWTRVLAPRRGKLGYARTARLKNLGPAKFLKL